MQQFLYKLEKKFGKYAIKNLSLIMIIMYGIGYVMQLVVGNGLLRVDFFEIFALNPYQIMHGQVWRLVSWLLIPPEDFNLFTIIMLYFYLSIGRSLEATWGAFRYNLYIFSGIIFTVIGAFVLYGIYMGKLSAYDAEAINLAFTSTGSPFALSFMSFSSYYVCMSIFLAFAATFPNSPVLLMFFIPVKIKILGFIYGGMLLYNLINSLVNGDTYMAVIIIASVLNFIVFFLLTRNYRRLSPGEFRRKKAYKDAAERMYTSSQRGTYTDGRKVITRHKCAICGRTELDGDNMEFRFCTKCDGNYEYCQDHIYTHEHVRRI